MLNSRKRSDSSIFCINAKTCTTRNLHEVLQARQYQRMISKLPGWSFLFCFHRTVLYFGSVVKVGVGQDSAERVWGLSWWQYTGS